MKNDHFMACIKKSIILVIRILITELWIANIIGTVHTHSMETHSMEKVP